MLQDPNKIFNQDSPEIQNLIKEKKWRRFGEKNRILQIFNYVKNDIRFGFPKKALLSASQVVNEGRANAFNKSILLKTLLDASGILCRFHAFTVKKEIYNDIVPPLRFKLLPNHLISAWVEVFFDGQWIVIDGVQLDEKYFNNISKKFHEAQKEFVGYGCALYLESGYQTDWDGKTHSYNQRAAITRDHGVIEEFEWFFEEFAKDIKQLRKIRSKKTNLNIKKIRDPKK